MAMMPPGQFCGLKDPTYIADIDRMETTFRTGIAWLDDALEKAVMVGPLPDAAIDSPLPAAPPLDIIVPVCNAFDALQDCVQSLIAHCDSQHRFWLYDDASDDARIQPWCEDLSAGDARFRYLRNEQRLGFVANANRAMARTDRDLILLNSDTRVTAGWIDRIWRCSQSAERVGVVSPLSNNASLLSVTGPLTPGDGLDKVASEVAATGTLQPVALPTAVGFCMFIRRALINDIGDFDSAFSPGYGEEVDFCLRAWRAGWRVLACTDAFVFHRGGASFGDGAQAPSRRHQERLLHSRWPDYEGLVRGWWRRNPLRMQIQRLAARRRQRPLVVHLLHRWGTLGGTEHVASRLIESLSDEFDHLVLVPGRDRGVWADAVSASVAPGIDLLFWNQDMLDEDWRILDAPAGLHNPWLDRWLAEVLSASDAALLHIHHLLGWDTLMPGLIGKALGIPVISSLHCFHYLCPDYGQIGPDGHPCGKSLVETQGECVTCLASRTRRRRGEVEPQLPEFLSHRRMLVRQALRASDAVVSPSDFLIRRFVRAFGPALNERLHSLPHPPPPTARVEPARAGQPLVLAFLGGSQRLKGFHTLIRAVQLAGLGAALEVRIHGGDASRKSQKLTLPANCRWLGPYRPEDLGQVLAPADAVVVPSIVEESFSLAVSEAWAHGRPVITSDSGALAERVRNGINGWQFPADNAECLAERLCWLVSDEGREQLRRISQDLCRAAAVPEHTALHEYRKLYRRLAKPGLTRLMVQPAAADTDPALMRRHLDAALARLPGQLADSWRVPGGLPEHGRVQVWITDADCASEAELAASLEALKDHGDLAEPLLGSAAWARRARQLAGDTWIWLLRAGEKPLLGALPALRACLDAARPDETILVFDHVHHSRDGITHGLVCKPAWDPWLAATSTDFDSGWLIRAGALLDLVDDTEAAVEWPLPLLDPARSQATVKQIALAILSRPDIALNQAAARLGTRVSRLAGGVDGKAMIKPRICLLDGGSLGDLCDSLDALIPLRTRIESVHLPEASAALVPARFEQQLPLARSAPPVDDHCLIVMRPGVLIADFDALLRHWGCFADPRVGAVGLATFSAAGERLGAARVAGHAAGRLRPMPAWPGRSAPDQPVLRQASRLSLDLALLRRDRIESIEHLAAGRTSQAWLLAGAQVCGRWARGALILDALDEYAPDPAFSARLSLRHAGWQPDPIAMQVSSLRDKFPQVLGIAGNGGASTHYRLIEPLRALADQGAIAPPVIALGNRHGLPNLAEIRRLKPDLIVLHGWLDDGVLDLLDHQRVILSLDDLITAPPQYNPFSRHAPGRLRHWLERMLKRADRVIVSSQALAEALAPARCRVVENAIAPAAWSGLPGKAQDAMQNGTRARRLRVGWAGAQQHEGDLRLLKPVVRATAGQVDWVFFGMCPDYLRPWAHSVIDPVSYADYPRQLAGLGLDVAVAPLVDNDFNRCKSALKLLEYGALGLAVIASDLPPYRGSPACLAGPTAAAWIDCIERYVNHPEQARADGRALRDWVWRNHTLASRTAVWQDALLGRDEEKSGILKP